MKRIFITVALLLGVSFGFSQESKTEDKDLMTWYHKDFKATKIYGINTQNAYKFLESKGLKPQTVVVAVVDGGVEVDHPGLVKNIWKNVNEVPNNGKDDDGNGYVDDVHGWNFIGGKDGDVGVDNMEITRTVRKYKALFESANSADNQANKAKMPNEFVDYLKAKEMFSQKSIEAKQNFQFYSEFSKAIPEIAATLKGKTLTKENLASITPATQEEARNLSILSQVAEEPSMKGKSQEEVQKFLEKEMKSALDHFEPQATKQYNLDYDPRSIVGDNYNDLNEKYYGNNHYEGPDALHGTHVSGIIAGYPQGKEVQYGVAYKVAKIMVVRAVPDGDERDKDIANSIKYAVDNGAKIINMSFGKPFSPNKDKVWEAFQYAQDKGVLLVHAAGNDNQNLEEDDNFPTNFKSKKDEVPFINNLITVGASTNDSEFLRADFSNYSGKMVDVFAPGDKIYSTVTDGKYEYEQGTSMASPVVAGASAILLAYMPTLKPEQIIEALVKTANKSEVNAMLKTNVKSRFDLISQSGGVIDIYKAAQYAFENFYQTSIKKSSTKPVLKKVK